MDLSSSQVSFRKRKDENVRTVKLRVLCMDAKRRFSHLGKRRRVTVLHNSVLWRTSQCKRRSLINTRDRTLPLFLVIFPSIYGRKTESRTLLERTYTFCTTEQIKSPPSSTSKSIAALT